MTQSEQIDMIPFQMEEGPEAGWLQPGECPVVRTTMRRKPIAGEWAEKFSVLIETFKDDLSKKRLYEERIMFFQREVELLKQRCSRLEELSPILVPIQSLAPEPYEVIKPFHAVVQVQDDQYIATFFDANISASGDTETEAIFNLKDMIVGTFDVLSETSENKLGSGPAQQKKVLQEFIAKKE